MNQPTKNKKRTWDSKKNAKILERPAKQKVIFINSQRDYYPLEVLCKAVEISKSTYYRLRNKPSTEDKHLKITDNAVMESFFSRYWAEIKGFPKPKSIDDVTQNAFDWVWFYDKERISLPKKIKKKKNF